MLIGTRILPKVPINFNTNSLPENSIKVFNICIECKMSTEALHEKRLQFEDLKDDLDSDKQSSDGDEFFEPEEEEMAVDLHTNEIPDRSIAEMLKIQAAALNPSHNRIGARCPVPDGMPLIKTGDQVG